MVGVFGESLTAAAGVSAEAISSAWENRIASTFAAKPPADRTKVSSPIGDGQRNSSDFEPPMAPASAFTITYSRPRRLKIRS